MVRCEMSFDGHAPRRWRRHGVPFLGVSSLDFGPLPHRGGLFSVQWMGVLSVSWRGHKHDCAHLHIMTRRCGKTSAHFAHYQAGSFVLTKAPDRACSISARVSATP